MCSTHFCFSRVKEGVVFVEVRGSDGGKGRKWGGGVHFPIQMLFNSKTH
jgi:hypothetical protein